MMTFEFLANEDGMTASMIVNGKLVEKEIPYIPEKCIDHRGAYLYHYVGHSEYKIKNEDYKAIISGVNYLKNGPHYVLEAIREGRIKD